MVSLSSLTRRLHVLTSAGKPAMMAISFQTMVALRLVKKNMVTTVAENRANATVSINFRKITKRIINIHSAS